MKRYDPIYDRRGLVLEEAEYGECLKREEVLERLVDLGIEIDDELVSGLGFSEDEYQEAIDRYNEPPESTFEDRLALAHSPSGCRG